MDICDGVSGNSTMNSIPVMIMNLMGTKTNQSIENRDYGVVLRNRYPLTCTIGALSFYLFARYSKIEWPSFKMNKDWYRVKVFINLRKVISILQDPLKELSYAEHNSCIKKLLQRVGIMSSKVTHIGRKGGLNFLGMLNYLIRYDGHQ